MIKLLTLLLFIPTLLYSQRLEEFNDNYRARVEYSVNDKSVDYIFDNAKSWIAEEFPQRKIEEVVYPKSKRISGIVYNKKLSFHIEIICYDGSFIAKFSDFYINKKSLKGKKVDKVNQYLYSLSGRMQNYIRYKKLI